MAYDTDADVTGADEVSSTLAAAARELRGELHALEDGNADLRHIVKLLREAAEAATNLADYFAERLPAEKTPAQRAEARAAIGAMFQSVAGVLNLGVRK